MAARNHPLEGGELSVDPTENVKALAAASSQRQDDLRALTRELYDTKVSHLQYLVELFARFQSEKGVLEANRIDSIRHVDREEVAKTAAAAQQAIATLASTTTTMAETLRNQVANTAAAAESRQQTYASEINKRLSALELGSSEGKGRQSFADPLQAEMVSELKAMRQALASGGGKTEGQKNIVAYISVGISILLGLLLLADRLR